METRSVMEPLPNPKALKKELKKRTYPFEEEDGPVEVPPPLQVAGPTAEGFRAAGVRRRRLLET